MMSAAVVCCVPAASFLVRRSPASAGSVPDSQTDAGRACRWRPPAPAVPAAFPVSSRGVARTPGRGPTDRPAPSVDERYCSTPADCRAKSPAAAACDCVPRRCGCAAAAWRQRRRELSSAAGSETEAAGTRPRQNCLGRRHQ